jgi:hypothetical protein
MLARSAGIRDTLAQSRPHCGHLLRIESPTRHRRRRTGRGFDLDLNASRRIPCGPGRARDAQHRDLITEPARRTQTRGLERCTLRVARVHHDRTFTLRHDELNGNPVASQARITLVDRRKNGFIAWCCVGFDRRRNRDLDR